MSADEVLEDQSAGGGAVADALEWLESELIDSEEGWILQKDIQTLSRAEGHSWASVRRAKDKLKVASRKLRKEDSLKHAGQWIWVLPDADKVQQGAQGAQGVQHSGEGKHEHVAENGQGAQGLASRNHGHVEHVEQLAQGVQDSSTYSDELLAAGSAAVSGLSITAGYFISKLDPEDYLDIINNPAAARSTAVSMASRR